MQDLAACAGQKVGASEWLEVTQERINQFAAATGDHQWIHVDPERARTGPFGAPIAHGFLTLSLLPVFFDTAFEVLESGVGLNYGVNKVRFTAPVPVNSRVRGHLTLLAAEPIDKGGIQMTWQISVEREGADKPVCVAEAIVRRYP